MNEYIEESILAIINNQLHVVMGNLEVTSISPT